MLPPGNVLPLRLPPRAPESRSSPIHAHRSVLGVGDIAPIVQRVGADRKAHHDSAHASILDLAEAKMRVMSPLLPPDREEARLDESLMGEVLWEGVG